MTDFDWEKAAGREHDRMVDELNDLREAKARVEAERDRYKRRYKATLAERNQLLVSRPDQDQPCEICAYMRKALKSCPGCGEHSAREERCDD